MKMPAVTMVAAWISAEMGVATAEAIFATAQDWYGSLFLGTGLVAGSYDLLLPDDASISRTPELGALAATPLWPWVAERLLWSWWRCPPPWP